MTDKLNATHGTVCDLAEQYYGYFGWPTVGKLGDGTLIVVSSGMRMEHVDPTGRTVIHISRDEGKTWSSPRVINDSPFDDRDAGVISLGGSKALVTWFTSDTRNYMPHWTEEYQAAMKPGIIWESYADASQFIGSWTSVTDDNGATWSKPARCDLTTPHGPILLRNGDLLYFGKEFGKNMEEFMGGVGDVAANVSSDAGKTWRRLGAVPLYPGIANTAYHEPHVVELGSGKLLGLIRLAHAAGDTLPDETPNFSNLQTESTDGGKTWSKPTPWSFRGSPPHLMLHSSGALVCVYGHRDEPFGERVSISHDEGATWRHSLVLRDDGPDTDLGYPSSVEVGDGSIFTLYYQKPRKASDKCALLYSRWHLPTR